MDPPPIISGRGGQLLLTIGANKHDKKNKNEIIFFSNFCLKTNNGARSVFHRIFGEKKTWYKKIIYFG